MLRPSKDRTPKLSGDSQRLASLALALARAGSRLEERAWEHHVDALVDKMLKHDRQAAVEAVLDYLSGKNSSAYEALMESIEAVSSSCTIVQGEHCFDALLIAAPILAWTRFSIASGPIPTDTVQTLSAHFYAHVLASGTKMAIMPNLYAIDQMPGSHAEVYSLTRRMAQSALNGIPLRRLVNPPETAHFLADTRYLLAVVVAPAGAPLFRWQMPDAQIDMIGLQQQSLAQWRAQIMPTMERLFSGCGIELLLPEAYYVACREADKQIRPASIRAAVHFLTHTLGVEPDQLAAIIGGFAEESTDGRVDEYRISFTRHQQPDVVYGVVWPIYEEDDAEPIDPASHLINIAPPGQPAHENSLQTIFRLLREAGITSIKLHSEQFLMESCDDCGAPLYCDWEAELVHAAMPEDAPHTTEHFH
jgi:hypothetical protein